MNVRAVRFNLDPYILAQAIHLPPAVRIVDAKWNNESGGSGTILLTVESHTFPNVAFGDIPTVEPAITTQRVTWEWNLPKPDFAAPPTPQPPESQP